VSQDSQGDTETKRQSGGLRFTTGGASSCKVGEGRGVHGKIKIVESEKRIKPIQKNPKKHTKHGMRYLCGRPHTKEVYVGENQGEKKGQ